MVLRFCWSVVHEQHMSCHNTDAKLSRKQEGPDKDYENYRWKPTHCDLPRFDPKKFFELMRGMTLAFIGDSVGRNQMKSMLCTLCQTSEPFDFASGDVVKLHLDAPDEDFMDFLPTFDVVVLSFGHWFAKQSVYIYKNEIVGGQLWWPDNCRPKKVGSVAAFGISMETILTAIATYPNYTGLVIVCSYSPDHYEGGAWNTGGSCMGKLKPALDAELAENSNTDKMHEQQMTGFNNAVKKLSRKSRLKLMDITKAFQYWHDGHPGPYRNPEPNKKTKRRSNGEPPPQDCLHWCMPGPVDTWNQLVLEIIRRDSEGTESLPAAETCL
ncbi:hypothetical protein GIB67_034242 [Kingdonia uniflora]|uniref:Trichome birefringence-like C-terminal domain-containing protein n=1 Tax=Kingdonia uniflora TaxID=39325 RepID=A0A7J7NS25_9MAGN|nr:hypothetical protein GIB67_034242 [Kingdonia uniflora]